MPRIALAACLFLLVSCAPAPRPSASLLLYRFDPPALLEYSADLHLLREIPFSLPPQCGLFDLFPAPAGETLLIELNCPSGQTLLFFDLETASAFQPFSAADSHFLAWQSDGRAAYLKVDSLFNPRIVRVRPNGAHETLPISEFTYDLAASPASTAFTFTFSRGLGYGSELYLTSDDGRTARLLHADPAHYISFVRFSPNGEKIAFIKIPDTATPFPVGELWVADADGSNARLLASADAGHGYAANWSPDGTRIAFVVRENPQDEQANRASEALLSNIYVIEAQSGQVTQITRLANGRAETPHWSPDGNTLTFNVVVDGRMSVFLADLVSGENRPLVTESACCPAWMRK